MVLCDMMLSDIPLNNRSPQRPEMPVAGRSILDPHGGDPAQKIKTPVDLIEGKEIFFCQLPLNVPGRAIVIRPREGSPTENIVVDLNP
jgi:hypothetical protein